jgi:epsilon-lactone hydrolase
MASRESEELKTLFRGWAAALAANPEMPLDQMRLMFEHLGDVTGEPGGVDYLETDAGGMPALWAVPKGCAEDRALLCLHGAAMSSVRCIRIARSTVIWLRRSAVAP